MKKIVAKEGYYYTDSKESVFTKNIFLGVNDKEENYHLVTVEYGDTLIAEREKENEELEEVIDNGADN